MASRKGFSFIDILLVLIIIGILLAIALPNYDKYIFNSKVQAVENNLRAIAAAQQKYHEDHGYYCSPTYGCNDFGSINQNLSLQMSTETYVEGFVYTCAPSGTCSAIISSAPTGQPNQVNIDANGNLTCLNSVSVPCP
jgi:prepilin-type N-terminal cleavage/methylation domain-containing protein